MQSISLHFVFLLAVLFSLNSFSKLPELKTKQTLKNIRFITNDGKFTYYQQNNGELQLSTNYANEIVLSKKKFTNFYMYSSEHRKKLIVEVNEDYHTNLNFNSLNELYSLNLGETKPIKIGEGTAPKLNINDTWISYFNNKDGEIIAKNLALAAKNITIKLRNKLNPFFIPEHFMATPDTLFYTDINDQGFMALLMYSIADKKYTPVYKTKFKGMRIEACLIGDNIYLGEFSYDFMNKGSSIYKIPIFGNSNFKKKTNIYSSQLDDLGNMTCNKDEIYFIKTLDFNKELNIKKSEVALLNLKSNEIKVITDFNYVTNIVNMDQIILIPFRDKYFVAKGKENLTKDEIRKKL